MGDSSPLRSPTPPRMVPSQWRGIISQVLPQILPKLGILMYTYELKVELGWRVAGLGMQRNSWMDRSQSQALTGPGWAGRFQ